MIDGSGPSKSMQTRTRGLPEVAVQEARRMREAETSLRRTNMDLKAGCGSE